MRYSFILILVLLFTSVSCNQKQTETTLYLVRHAEKDTLDKGENPPLIEEGYQRAERLKDVLKNEGIEQVYSTKYDRNLNTVKPLLDLLKKEAQIYDWYDYHSSVDAIKVAGKTTVLCGHGDNLLPIISHLNGKPPYASLGHNDYDNLFKLTILSDTTLVEVIKF